jgi:predicted nucleic acid-binding protein
VLFDTTFFIDLEREATIGRPGRAAAFLATHRGQNKRVTTVTLGEFAIGAGNMAAVRKFFRGYLPMALGREDAVYAGQLQARLAFEMGENDLWIAGIALRHGLPLVTRDAAFSRVPGLRVVPY